MKLPSNTLLRVSLIFNILLVIALSFSLIKRSELKNQNQENLQNIETLKKELVTSRLEAQMQRELAEKQMTKARVAAQQALANQEYARYQAEQANKKK